MATRPPTWIFVILGVQLAVALLGVLAVSGMAEGMAGHPVAFAHDDIPLLFPAIAVLVLGALALALWARDHRKLAKVLTFAPYPVAALLMIWALG